MSEDTTVYYIQIDFVGGVEVDGKFISDPPNVFICSEEGMILEVLEEPIFIGGDLRIQSRRGLGAWPNRQANPRAVEWQ